MRLALLLFWIVFTFGQSTSSPPESKAQRSAGASSQKQDFGLGTGAKGAQMGTFEILSDTKGVDFKPYLKQIQEVVRQNWYILIPESARTKKGKLAIEFAITTNGKVADMRLVASSGDVALDRPAWGSITNSNPFPPLPSEFTGSFLALRFRFSYNPDKNDSSNCGKDRSDYPVKVDSAETHTKTTSGIAISISAPADLQVPLGGSKTVTATVTGTGAKENSVDWGLSGLGCSGATCGEMTKDTYHAPTVMPSPPFVTLTAVSKADPTAKASVTVHIVQSAPSQ